MKRFVRVGGQKLGMGRKEALPSPSVKQKEVSPRWGRWEGGRE